MKEMHEEAKKRFNDKANEFIDSVKPAEMRPRTGVRSPNSYISGKITREEIIGEIDIALANMYDDTLGFQFNHKNNLYEISGNDYKKLEDFCSRLCRNPRYRDTVSFGVILSTIKTWIKSKFRNQEQRLFVDTLDQSLKGKINEYEIWIPIPFTSTEMEFKIGSVWIKEITSELVDLWIPTGQNASGEYIIEELKSYREKIKKEHQGQAAAVTTCFGEQKKAEEIAIEKTSICLDILRLYSPANFSMRIISGAYEYGAKMIETKELFVFDSKGKLISQDVQNLDPNIRFTIPKLISDHFRNDNNPFSSLITLEKMNKYQTVVLNAIRIYSQHTLKRSLFDRLLYIFSALESILIANETEPIQSNIAERMAFAISAHRDKRRSIVKLIKDVYADRSKYVHHGEMVIKDTDKYDEFLKCCWIFFSGVAANVTKFRTKEEFISSIDDIKFS